MYRFDIMKLFLNFVRIELGDTNFFCGDLAQVIALTF